MMWRRAGRWESCRDARQHRTGDLSGPKVTPAMSADVTDCLRENLVEMLGAFEASRKLAIRRS